MSSLTTAKTPRLFVLIPCAGVGSRALDPAAPSGVPKQYQAVAGQPLVLHTLAAFAGVSRVADVLVVVAPDDTFFEDASAPCVISHTGGASRAETVANGLHDLFELGASGRRLGVGARRGTLPGHSRADRQAHRCLLG